MGKSLNFRALQFSVFVLLILSVLFLFNACNKDKEFADPLVTVRNDATSAILGKINFDQDGNILLNTGSSQVVLKHANIEKQREVSDYIFDNLSFSRIDSMREMYGLPVWELATIDINNNNDNYLITIPLVKDNKFTSILFYQNNFGQKNIHLFDAEKINKIISYYPSSPSFIRKWMVPLGKFNTYFLLINSINNLNLQNWLTTNRALLHVNDQLTYRDVEEICITIFTELVVTSEGPSYICWDWCITFGSGGSGSGSNNGSGSEGDFNGYFGDDDFGNDWNDGGNFGSSGAGGTGTFGDSNDNVPKVDKAKKLLCANEVSDFMAQAEILQLIADNNLLDPCDPNKTASALLQTALEGYCYAKSGDAPLNLQDAQHFMGEIMEAQINQIISCMNNNDGFNIDGDPYGKLNECEKKLVRIYPLNALVIMKNKDKAEKMTAQIFGDNFRNECSDAFRHALFNAMNTSSCGSTIAKLFGDAHECDTPTERLKEKEMDLFNNAIGLEIAYNNMGLTIEMYADLICEKLENGELMVLSDPPNPWSSTLIQSYGCKCK